MKSLWLSDSTFIALPTFPDKILSKSSLTASKGGYSSMKNQFSGEE